ncbi:MAG: outer membrane protein assembly factor, partial [Burkholderiales bacterium]
LADSRQDIPSENLFRTGGTQSIRGYSYLSLGVPEAGAIVGGRVLALASLEYQHPIAPSWYGAAFVDVGNAADRWVDYREVWGYGAGVRWRSPIGPVSLDLAYGEAVGRWRLHLSVGYAF